jgi:hypothetical protein
MGGVASHALLSSLNLILGAVSCQLASLLTDDNSRSGQGITHFYGNGPWLFHRPMCASVCHSQKNCSRPGTGELSYLI